MPSSMLFLHDGRTDRPVRLASDETIFESSEHCGWDGIAVERQQLPPSEPEGYMPWHLLSVLLTPAARFEEFDGSRSRRVPQKAGDIVFRPAGVVTRAAWEGVADTVNVALSPQVVGRVAAEMLDGGTVSFERSHFRADPAVAHLACALLHQIRDTDPVATLVVDSTRTALAARLVAMYGQSTPLVRRGRALRPAEVARVRELVDAQLAAPLTLADLAGAVPLSPYHFSRAFKMATGMTPHEFVVRRRIEAAKTLLARGNLLVEEIARRTGFADASHLARQFRRRVGTSPAAYAAARRS